ncbi:MAG: hypothetical protein IRY94_07590 [Rhodospirillaceae bacterium]|nr:hypothetical protein [Rhodospirillaceae bacterium]
METVLGMSLALFLGLTVCLFGLAAWLMGQALANTWRPAWQNVVYGLMLGVGDRFLAYALFGEPPLSVSGYVINTAVLIGIALLAYRLTRAHKMVSQYPWLYEKTGPLSWRQKS